jgi:hypothetical protein
MDARLIVPELTEQEGKSPVHYSVDYDFWQRDV